MRIGICGSHRAGKTTLARLISAEYNLPLIASPASAIAAKYGFDMSRDNRLDAHMVMQQEIYNNVCAGLQAGSFVADRTPIDVAAYTMADATAGAGTYEVQQHAVLMMESALVETSRLFDIVLLIPPAINFIIEDGKPPMNPAYQEHHHLLCRGMLLDDDLNVYWDELARDCTGLTQRMDWVRASVANAGIGDFNVRVAA